MLDIVILKSVPIIKSLPLVSSSVPSFFFFPCWSISKQSFSTRSLDVIVENIISRGLCRVERENA